MRRKTLWIAGTALVIAVIVLATLAYLVRHEPEFYHAKALPPSPQRAKQSKSFESQCFYLFNAIQNQYPTWQATFSEDEINSYLEEGFIQSNVASTMLPDGVSSPRVSVENNNIVRLGFRYGEDPWSTIVNIDFRVWMTPKERNVIALQILGVHAGMLPISSKFFMDQISDALKSQNRDIDIVWYRNEGQIVALLRFGQPGPHATTQLELLKVGDGKIVVAGRSLGAAPVEINPPKAKIGIKPKLIPTSFSNSSDDEVTLPPLTPKSTPETSSIPEPPNTPESPNNTPTDQTGKNSKQEAPPAIPNTPAGNTGKIVIPPPPPASLDEPDSSSPSGGQTSKAPAIPDAPPRSEFKLPPPPPRVTDG